MGVAAPFGGALPAPFAGVLPPPVPMAFWAPVAFGGPDEPPISRSVAFSVGATPTGVTIPERNMYSCVPILIADETTM